MRDGSVIEERQPHLRGGAHEPLTRQDIEDKFVLNARHGGWPEARIAPALTRARAMYRGPLDVGDWREWVAKAATALDLHRG
jgi:hypothetical protein